MIRSHSIAAWVKSGCPAEQRDAKVISISCHLTPSTCIHQKLKQQVAYRNIIAVAQRFIISTWCTGRRINQSKAQPTQVLDRRVWFRRSWNKKCNGVPRRALFFSSGHSFHRAASSHAWFAQSRHSSVFYTLTFRTTCTYLSRSYHKHSTSKLVARIH